MRVRGLGARRMAAAAPTITVARLGAITAGLAGAAILAAGAGPARAGTIDRAENYLLEAQNSDGGFGRERGAKSDRSLTGWAALGLAAAGHNPRQRTTSGASSIRFLRSQPLPRDPGGLARTLLVLKAAGLPAHFSGRDIRADLIRHRRLDGSYGGLVNLTAFGILATSRTGDPRTEQSAVWLTQQQNPDGGFYSTPGGESGVDDTAAVLQALVAAGMGESPTAERAVDYLLVAQQANGGFASVHSRSPNGANSMSTTWAMQGLIAAGLDPSEIARQGRTPIHYLRSLQNADGSIRYSRESNHNPVWATAQVLPALIGEPFPLEPVPAPEREARTSAQAATERSEAGNHARPQQAAASDLSRAGLMPIESAGRTAATTPARRANESAPPPARSEGESRSHREQKPTPRATDGSADIQGQPVHTLALILSAVLALVGLASWWHHGRKGDPPVEGRNAPSHPSAPRGPGPPGPMDDFERELAELLERESNRRAEEPQTDVNRDRVLEPVR